MKWTALAVVALLGVAACAGEDAEQEPMDGMSDTATTAAQTPAASDGAAGDLPPGVTPEMVAQGQQVFTGAGNCFTCHGMNGEGTPLAPNLTDAEWINIDGEYESIVNNVRTGVPTPKQHPAPMPAMGGAQLTDEQIRAVAAYVYTLAQRS